MRLYRRDEAAPPDPDEEGWCFECDVRIGGGNREKNPVGWSIVPRLEDNGFYYFTVSALGDGISYTDSPYVVSDAFLYKGEEAPELSAPTGLAWKIYEIDNNRYYYATWDNMDDYEDKDTFNVTFYDETDTYVMNNTWTKEAIIGRGYEGIPIRAEYMSENGKYRFTVQVYSSRPNEYQSSPMPAPIPEEYYSPWLSLKYIKPDGEDGAE